MGIWDSPIWNRFDARYKKAAWILLILLITVVIGLTIPRMFLPGPKSRSTFMALGMGAKSLIFLAYEISTEYSHRLQKWRSYKANTILNGLDVLFWAVVAGINFAGNLRFCTGATCFLAWAVVVVAVAINQIYIFAFVMCWREWKGLTGGHTTTTTLRREGDLEKVESNSSTAPMYAAKTAYESADVVGSVADDQRRSEQARSQGRI